MMRTKFLLMMLVAAALFALSAAAGAAEVAIVNPGFEDPVLTDGGYTYYPTGWVEGWYELGAADPNDWWGYSWGSGAINPDAGYGYDGIAPEGENIAFTTPYPGYDQGLSQILSDTLQADWIYELSVQVGNPSGYNGGAAICDYRIELVADGVKVAANTGPSPAPDTWKTVSLTFSAGTDHPQIGGALEIRLIAVDFSADYELSFDDVRLNAISDPMEPSPYNGEYVYVGDVDLSWTNMDPNEGVTDVYVDVWFGLDPAKPNKWDKVVDAGKNITTVQVSAPVDQTTYYWQVNSYIGGSATGDPIEGRIYKFHTTTDIPPSVEIVSGDMITWSGEPVQLDATVEDDGVSDLTYLWSAAPPDGVEFSDPSVEDPIVTLTKDFSVIPIVNAGFEADILNDDGWGGAPGWSAVGTTGSGSWNPPATAYASIPEGDNVAWVGFDITMDPTGAGGGLAQVLAETLTSDAAYELKVEVGKSPVVGYAWPGYKVQLLAGGAVIAEDDNTLSIDVGTFETSTIVYTYNEVADANKVGLPLEIRLLAKVPVGSGWNEMNFDDVRLTADPGFIPTWVQTVTVTVAVSDTKHPTPDTASIEIDVYDDACYAAIDAGVVNPGDINANCITGLEDLAEMLLTWTDDNALTAPMAKEGSQLAAVANTGTDMVAYWPFDEGTGDVAYDFMGLNDAAMTDQTWVTPGKLGYAAISVTSATQVNAGSGPTPTTEDLTLAWWMIDNHGSYGTIMSKSAENSASGYNILVRPASEDSPLRFRIGGWQSYGDWNEECRLPVGAYNDGEWVHITCTYDSATDTATIYVNGELVPNGDYNPKVGGIAGDDGYCDGVNNATEPLYIVGPPEDFTGLIDEVAIWDTALTPDQVRNVYESGVIGATDTFHPSPADGGYVHPTSELELSWTNLPPNTPGDPVYVDVWFGTEPNETNPAYDMTKVVDANTPAGENANSVTVDASTLWETYYWRVNSYLDGSVTGDPIKGPLWRFHAVTDVPVSVEVGGDMITWSGEAVQLDGTVEDEGESAVTIAWSADPDDGVVFTPNEFVEDPIVTITKATDNPSVVTLTFSGQDEAGYDEDRMKIEVYDTACLAAIGEKGVEIDPGDFDADCDTDLADFAVIAEEWLDDYTLTAPAPKP